MLEDGGGKGTGTSSTSQCDTEMLCSGEGKDMAWERGLRSKSRICPKGILPWRSPKWEERAGGKSQLKHLEQLSNRKWLLPCHSIPVSPNTGPEARDEERFIKESEIGSWVNWDDLQQQSQQIKMWLNPSDFSSSQLSHIMTTDLGGKDRNLSKL